MAYWLMKSEPDAFSIDDLERVGTEPWDGIRNYQVRNMIRDQMKPGDRAFFYHSNTKVPGIVGIMDIVSQPRADHTAFDPDEKYYDPKSDPDKPRWLLVDVRHVRDLKRIVTLAEMKRQAGSFGDFQLLAKGNRLSIMPVSEEQWNRVLELEKRSPE